MRTTLVLLLLAAPSIARSDQSSEYFYKAQAAFDHGDCPAAARAFEAVTGPLRDDTRWIRAAAKAHDCAGDLQQALSYWRILDQRKPNDAEIGKAIGDLEYRIDRTADEKAKKDAADAEAARIQAIVQTHESCLRDCSDAWSKCLRDVTEHHQECLDECDDCDVDHDFRGIDRCDARTDEATNSCRSEHDDCEKGCPPGLGD